MMEPYTAMVADVVAMAPDVVAIRLTVGERLPFSFKPGQYVLVHPVIGGEEHVKPYSIASPPSERRSLELCIKAVPDGPVSHFMFNLKKGDALQLTGPLGRFTLQDRVENDLIFAATGTGISALKPMIEMVFERGTNQRVVLFFGCKTAEEILYRKEFESLVKKHANFRFIPVVSRDPAFPGEKGHVQNVIPKYVKDPKGRDIYICGVLKMVEETIAWAERYGFERERVHFEKYV